MLMLLMTLEALSQRDRIAEGSSYQIATLIAAQKDACNRHLFHNRNARKIYKTLCFQTLVLIPLPVTIINHTEVPRKAIYLSGVPGRRQADVPTIQ